jgi:glucose-1-phosphate thymidylyltransferase
VKALVLAGGSGTRLRPFSSSMPKQLFPIANKPVLEHVLENIHSLGVTDVGIVVGERGAAIADAIGDGSRFGATVTYIRQDQPLGLAHGVILGRDFLGDDDFVLYLGDNVLPDGIAAIAEQFRSERSAARVIVRKVADPRPFGVVELSADGTVRALVEKPRHPPSDLALVGVYFFRAPIHTAVTAITPSTRGELEITDAIQWLLTHGAQVTVSEYAGYWRDVGEIDDVLDCNRKLLADVRAWVAGQVDAASRLDGHVVVGCGSKVVRSRIEGPVIVGANTVIEDSRIGPNASIGADCALRGTDLADSIVLDGAEISGLRGGVRRSVIGRFAAIRRCGQADGQHRLIVGDHTRIETAA